MKPAPFRYHAPRTVEEALTLLADLGDDAKVLAGGQSLVPLLNMRLVAPEHIVDIGRIDGLSSIHVTDDAVRVDALARHADVEHDEAAAAAVPLLRQAVVHVAHPAIRNRGTTVGSIAHADPSGEMPAVLALVGGSVEVASSRGTRTVDAADFFVATMEADLLPDEIVLAATFPRPPAGAVSAYDEFARRSGDYALAGVGTLLEVADGRIGAARLSFVSVTPTPDVLDVSDVLAGVEVGPLGDDVLRALEAAVGDHVEPEADIHASADYRRHLAGVLATRVVTQALGTQATTKEAP